MIKILNNEELTYQISPLTWEEDKCAQVEGKLSINKKTGKNNSCYLLVTLSDETSKKSFTQIIFDRSVLFDFLKDYDKQKLPCKADVKFIKSGQYLSIEIHRLHIDVPSEEELEEARIAKEASNKSMSSKVSEAIKSIKEPTLRRICFNIYKDSDFVNKVMTLPATEHSAYNEKGGLMHMISDTVNITTTMVTALNSDFGDDSVKFNLDLMKAGAILCNVGRAYMYEYDELGNVVKSEAGIIDNELFITRDVVMKEINLLRGNADKYNVDSDIIKELLHMLATSKNKLTNQSAILPRTKHAALLGDIVATVFTKGLFDNLEKTSDSQKVVKAYEAGRAYVLYDNVQKENEE